VRASVRRAAAVVVVVVVPALLPQATA